MSIYNRDYMREDGPSRRGGGPSTWSVITWLIVINATVYFAQIFSNTYSGASNFLALNPERLLSWQAYTLLTHQFSHAHLAHLLFNMVGLFFLGRLLLQWIHPRHILPIFLLGGIVGGLAQCAFSALSNSPSMIVGASGSIMAILFAAITLAPHREISFLFLFFIPVRLSMKKIGIIVIAVDVFTLLTQLLVGSSSGAGGEVYQTAVFAHFGGMAMGAIYMKTLYHSIEARGRRQAQVPRKKKKKKKFGIRVVKNAKAKDVPSEGPDKIGGKKKPYMNSDVDAILDKISAEGMHSLSAEEKKILEKSSEKLSRKVDGKS